MECRKNDFENWKMKSFLTFLAELAGIKKSFLAQFLKLNFSFHSNEDSSSSSFWNGKCLTDFSTSSANFKLKKLLFFRFYHRHVRELDRSLAVGWQAIRLALNMVANQYNRGRQAGLMSSLLLLVVYGFYLLAETFLVHFCYFCSLLCRNSYLLHWSMFFAEKNTKTFISNNLNKML